MRLIDADAFVAEHRKIYCENCERRKNSKGKIVYEVGGVPCRACYIGDVIDDVDCAPTVDAVQVVRCVDCRWYDGNWCNRLRISGVKAVEETWFCEDGERKQDG